MEIVLFRVVNIDCGKFLFKSFPSFLKDKKFVELLLSCRYLPQDNLKSLTIYYK